MQWAPLKQLTEKEQADIAKTKAEALKIESEAIFAATGTSGLTEDEAREYMRQRSLFGLEPDDTTPGTAKSYAAQT